MNDGSFELLAIVISVLTGIVVFFIVEVIQLKKVVEKLTGIVETHNEMLRIQTEINKAGAIEEEDL